MADIYFIAAIDDKNGLAKNGKLPWDLPEDRAYFRRMTEAGPVVMGQKTFESNNNRPFGTGNNYVLSQTKRSHPSVHYVQNIDEALRHEQGTIWVIGGGKIFTLLLSRATRLYLTRVEGDFRCDVMFPSFESAFHCIEKGPRREQNGTRFCYETYERIISK